MENKTLSVGRGGVLGQAKLYLASFKKSKGKPPFQVLCMVRPYGYTQEVVALKYQNFPLPTE